MKTIKISGKRYVKAVSSECGFDEEFKSNRWNRSEFTDKDGSDIVAYWSQDCSWIFYYYQDEKANGHLNWGAVAEGYMNSNQYTDSMFNDFTGLCLDGATIPEFDTFSTNLE